MKELSAGIAKQRRRWNRLRSDEPTRGKHVAKAHYQKTAADPFAVTDF